MAWQLQLEEKKERKMSRGGRRGCGRRKAAVGGCGHGCDCDCGSCSWERKERKGGKRGCGRDCGRSGSDCCDGRGCDCSSGSGGGCGSCV
ncbi:unnamed protein product, partial [Musa acuminata subsp. malaccensis]